MGIWGLYSCLKRYSQTVHFQNAPPSRIGLDAYPFLYKFKYDLDACIKLFRDLQQVGHTCILYVDGNPPKEKMEELARRRQQKEQANKEAEALKVFLEDPEKSGELDEQSREHLQKQIAAFELASYCIKKETREEFLRRVKEETQIPIVLCEGESDDVLIQASLKGEVDIVVANDMDLFVGGVKTLWVLGKTQSDPLFLEFRRYEISQQLGIHSKSWMDVAILAGYEKAPHLKRKDAREAISLIRYYGSLENLLSRRPELLQNNTLQEFLNARKFFSM